MQPTLEEAIAAAVYAKENGLLNLYPRSCIVLRDEIVRLQKLRDEIKDKDDRA